MPDSQAAQEARKSHKPSVPWRERPFVPLLTAAELLGLSPATIYSLEAKGDLTFRRIGGRTLVSVETIISLIDSAEQWTASDRGAAARSARSERARERWRP